jgi:type IV pilus assembly protein PilO
MLERLPFWGQVVLMFALALGCVGIAYYLWPNLKQKGEEIATLRTELEDMNAKILEGQAIERQLAQFEQEVANLQRKLGDIQQILPTDTETGDLLRWIKNMSDQSNLELKTFAPGSLKPVDFYKEFPIEMDVVGRYHDLGIFLDRVSKYSRIINVDNLRMGNNSGGGDKTIRASFTATTFVYDDKAAAGEAQQ